MDPISWEAQTQKVPNVCVIVCVENQLWEKFRRKNKIKNSEDFSNLVKWLIPIVSNWTDNKYYQWWVINQDFNSLHEPRVCKKNTAHASLHSKWLPNIMQTENTQNLHCLLHSLCFKWQQVSKKMDWCRQKNQFYTNSFDKTYGGILSPKSYSENLNH